MPRNGAGVYSLPAGNPVVTGTIISSTWANTTLSDIAAALTQSIARDGQTPVTANIQMNGFIHTNVGETTLRNQYATVGQIQDGDYTWCGTATGTANAITLSPSPAITAYAAGQRFQFIASASNTDAVTVAISGLTAKAITKKGAAALSAGDILISAVVDIIYDGTQFQIASGAGASDTFTNVDVTNDLHVFNDFEVDGDSVLNTLQVDGDSTFNGDTTFNGDVTLTENANIHGVWQYKLMDDDVTIGLEHDYRILLFQAADNPEARTVTLPDPATLTNAFYVNIINQTEFDITINADAAYPLVGSDSAEVTSITLSPHISVSLSSSGTITIYEPPFDGPVWTYALFQGESPSGSIVPFSFVVVAPGEAITAANGVHTQIMPPCRFTGALNMSIAGATTTGSIIVDMNADGDSIFTTRPTIDQTELNTLTGTPAVYNGTHSVQTDWWTLTIDIDDDGDGTALGPIAVVGSFEMLPQ